MNLYDNIDIDIFSVIVCIIIYIVSEKYNSSKTISLTILRNLLLCTIIGTFCDILTVVITAQIDIAILKPLYNKVVLNICDFLVYMFPGVFLSLWNTFIIYNTTEKKDGIKPFQRILIYAPAVFTLTLISFNFFGNYLYTITDDLNTINSDYFYIYGIGCTIALIITIIYLGYTYGKSKNSKSIVSYKETLQLSLYLILPIILAIVEILNFGLHLIFPGFLVSLGFIYKGIIKNMSQKDYLTNAMSRVAFEKYMDLNNPKNYSLAFADLDDLKKTNDTLGHSVGDNLLINFVNIIEDNLLPGSIIIRYGGDEFIIYYPLTITEKIEENISHIQDAIEKYNSKYELSNKYKIDYSIDYGVFNPQIHRNYSMLLKEVDDRMYAKKLAKKINRHVFIKTTSK